jgi:hypothetical protein
MSVSGRSKPGEFHLKAHDFSKLGYSHGTHWRPKRLRSYFKGRDALLTKMDIPSNFSQPNGCDIIYREGKLMPEIFREYAALK